MKNNFEDDNYNINYKKNENHNTKLKNKNSNKINDNRIIGIIKEQRE